MSAPKDNKTMAIPANQVPDDWTTNLEEMRTDFYWGTDGSGQLAAESVGITNPVPLMIKERSAGGDGYMFQDTNGIYLWSMPTDEVYKYTSPANRDAILAEMCKSAGRGKVEMTLMPPTSFDD